MNDRQNITVIGAGHGGKAMAAHLALMGFPVTLYNRTYDHISAIHERGGIDLESYPDGRHGLAHLERVTSDLGEALAQAAQQPHPGAPLERGGSATLRLERRPVRAGVNQ